MSDNEHKTPDEFQAEMNANSNEHWAEMLARRAGVFAKGGVPIPDKEDEYENQLVTACVVGAAMMTWIIAPRNCRKKLDLPDCGSGGDRMMRFAHHSKMLLGMYLLDDEVEDFVADSEPLVPIMRPGELRQAIYAMRAGGVVDI